MSLSVSIAIGLSAAITLGVQPSRAQAPPAGTSQADKLLLQIGADDGPAHETFVRIAGIAVSPGNLIYVLDGGERVVRAYGPDGAHRFSFGRAGGGPGEFLRPSRIVVDTLVHVFDAAQRRVSIFDLDGQLRETCQLRDLGELNLTQLHRLADGSYLGATTPRFAIGQSAHAPDITVVRVTAGASMADTLISFHSGGIAWTDEDNPGRWGLAPLGLGAGGAWALLGDSVIATVDGYLGIVSWYRVSRQEVSLVGRRSLGQTGNEISAGELQTVERQIRERPRQARLGKLRLILPPRHSAATVLNCPGPLSEHDAVATMRGNGARPTWIDEHSRCLRPAWVWAGRAARTTSFRPRRRTTTKFRDRRDRGTRPRTVRSVSSTA